MLELENHKSMLFSEYLFSGTVEVEHVHSHHFAQPMHGSVEQMHTLFELP